VSTLSTLTETPGSNLPTAATNGYDPFWHPKTPEELALVQGIQPIHNFEVLLGGWPEDELEDNFEETLQRWRQAEY